MSMSVRDVCGAIEAWAPLGYAYDWDKPGLSIGNPKARVTRVLVCLTVTRPAFRAARKLRAEMVVSHHPLIWEALKTLRTDDPHTRLCLDFAHAGIACYAAHTNLDVARGGVSAVLAEQLGLLESRPLFPVKHAAQVKLVTFVPETHLPQVRGAVSAAGAGVIGEYTHCSFSTEGIGTFKPGGKARPFAGKKGAVNEEAERRFEILVPKARLSQVLEALLTTHPYEEVAYDIVTLENSDPAIGLGMRGTLARPVTLRSFARHVCLALKVAHVRTVGPLAKRVRRVAVLGGAGGGEVGAVPGAPLRVPGGIDVLVTGDVKYHDACAAMDRDLAVIDAGHAATEKPIVAAMARYLRKELKGLKVTTYIEPEYFTVVTP